MSVVCFQIAAVLLSVYFLLLLFCLFLYPRIPMDWQNSKLESENIYSLYFVLASIRGHGCKKFIKCHECMSDCGCDDMTDAEFDLAVGKDSLYRLSYYQFHMIDPKNSWGFRDKRTRSPFSLQALSKLIIQKGIVAHIISIKQWTELVWYSFSDVLYYQFEYTNQYYPEINHLRFHFVDWLEIKNKIEQLGVPPRISHYLVPKLPWSDKRGDWVFRCSEEELRPINYSYTLRSRKMGTGRKLGLIC